jgi:hypothetical protein
MSRARFAALSVPTLIVLLFAAAPAAAWCRLSTAMPQAGDTCATTGIGLSWHRQCISFTVEDRMRPDPPLDQIRDVVSTSFATWMQVMCNGMDAATGASGQPVGLSIAQTQQLGTCDRAVYDPHGPNANMILFIQDWAARELPADAFGLTLVWHNPDTGEIYDADMQINETIGPLTICQGLCPFGAVDIQNVVTHEAGHFLGLGHSQVRTATMSARATIGETSKRTLDVDDEEGLCQIYGDFSPASCRSSDYTPNHGFTTTCDDTGSAGNTNGASSGGGSSSKTTLGCSIAEVRGGAAGIGAWVLLGWVVARTRTRTRTNTNTKGV